jgi:site-specific DNA-cytosine methylase
VEGEEVKVLVACEFSGIVRDAFLNGGHDAMSCDLLDSERPGPHYRGDARNLPLSEWDMLIAFPPCTDLAVSGARWFEAKRKDGRQQAAIEFFLMLADAPVSRIAIENPVGIMSNRYRKPSQIVHPWQFGHGETKATCLWLKNLPPLVPTNIVAGREHRIHRMPPSPNRGRDRSRTYQGIAGAMAEQWSNIS